MPNKQTPDYEVVVVGAGICGIYQLKRLVDLGVNVTLLEAAPNLGGTWYWNRYPGARFNSESYTYGYSFSKELLDEWHWKERFSGQPENLRYLNYVADKFDLRGHMQFNSRVETAAYDEARNVWHVRVAGGRSLSCRFLVMAPGFLSAPVMPKIDGRETFKGPQFHTFYWPHEPIDLKGKRVAIIGTGASGIQVISEIAETVEELVVFQRRPNWAAPLHNGPISAEEMAAIRARYDEIFAKCAKTRGGFEHETDLRGFYEVSREERVALWDKLYDEPGFGIWLSNFREVAVEEAANKEMSDYVADRIRQRVNDPAVAEKLIPRDHGWGTQRVPLETRYYEAYNRANVKLVDLSGTPIVTLTEGGVKTTEREYPVDIIVYATGFDPVTGPYDRMEITGVGGEKLADHWRAAVSTYLGVLVHGFPNMLMATGPQGGSVSANAPRGIETTVNWCANLLQYVREKGIDYIEATAEAEAKWRAQVEQFYAFGLARNAKSWFTGYNGNVEREDGNKPRCVVYIGGADRYSKSILRVAESGYDGIIMLGANVTPDVVPASAEEG